MERQLRAVEQKDPIESAAVLALAAAELKDLEGQYEEESEDEETGVA